MSLMFELVAPIPTKSDEVARYTKGLLRNQGEEEAPPQEAPVPDTTPLVSTCRQLLLVPVIEEMVREEDVVLPEIFK